MTTTTATTPPASEATEENLVSSEPPERPRAQLRTRIAGPAVAAALVVATLLITQLAIPHGTPAALLFQGLVDGVSYALAAVALVLVYRVTRIINFAQLAIGGVGAELAFELIRYERAIPFPVVLTLALVLSAGIGAAFDILMRRFSRAPRLLVMAFTVLLAYILVNDLSAGIINLPFLPPAGERPLAQLLGVNALHPFLPFSGFKFHVGHLPVPFGFPQLLVLEIAGIGLLAVAAFLALTKTGVAIRAAAENTERAVLLGISVAGLGTLVWALAGALAAGSALTAGISGNPGAAFVFDPTSLLPPLAAAALGKFANLPRTILAAVGIGVLADAVGYGLPAWAPDWIFGGLFVVIAGALFVQRRESLRLERAAASWRLVAEPRPVARELTGLGIVRGTRYTGTVALLAAIGLYPFLVNTRLVVIGSDIAVFGIVALSLVVLTGWAGQVSLGQYALAGIGAVVSGGLVAHAGVPFWFAVPIAVVIVAGIAALVGLPALRLPGLYLAVVSLAFGAAVYTILFDPKLFGWLLPVNVARPTLFFVNFDDERSMYYLALGAFVLAVVFCLNLRRGRTGRILIALRDNDSDVQALGIRVVRTKLLAFAISGGLAGFAGAIAVFVLRGAPQGDFSPDLSVQIFIYTLLGGVSSVSGGLIGAAILEVIVYFLTSNAILGYLASVLPIILLYVAPSGLVELLIRGRDSLLRIIAHRRQILVPSLQPELDAESLAGRLLPLSRPLPTGGLAALDTDVRYRLRSRQFGTELDQPDTKSRAPGGPASPGGEGR